jgi:molecular chaperone IbpA|tara:strand:- start:163 stop:657 length:495 start_codon:yes stop_codon:yes gene_type:complete
MPLRVHRLILLLKGDSKMVTNITKTLSLFDNINQLTPYAVGFDRVFDQLNTYVANNATSTGFPPYNIRKGGDYTYAIEMALAGFSKEDIEIEVAEGLLTVRSVKENDVNDTPQYRGISYRKFNRKFTLAEDIVVNDASLENGMLKIDLERIVPDAKKPRKITIK